jgi:hypothetical protein
MSDANCEVIAGFIHWESKKEKRGCRFTAAGETLACGSALYSALWLKRLWFELTGIDIPIILVTDSDGTAKNAVSAKFPR